jgi:hypothetical protein
MSYLASEAAAERAITTLKRAIDAAENSNQAGENFVVAAAAGPELLEALLTKRDYIADAASGALTYEGSGEGFKAMAAEDLARIDAAIAKATGAA